MIKKLDLPIEYAQGATPLTREEREGLKLRHVTNRKELDEVEQANIVKAQLALAGRRRLDCLSDKFLRSLHKKMFSDVWKWAGTYRQSGKNFGVLWPKIPEEISKLMKDTAYWIEHETYPWDELAIRFHHRLVSIHPFPNGNGRHARLMTDLLLRTHDQKIFTWGGGIGRDGTERERYLKALREADQKRFSELTKIARS